MTREQNLKTIAINAISEIENDTNTSYNITNTEAILLYKTIVELIDNFESQTCSVCKFYGNGICKNTENDITYVGWETAPMPTQRNQLCHKFERKEDV